MSFDLEAAIRRPWMSARSAAFLEAANAAAANFLISIFVARSYDAATFSGYITALSAAFVAIAFLRISLTTPSAIKPDIWHKRKLRALIAVHIYATLTAVFVIAAVLFGLASVLQSPLWFAAAVSAPGCGLWFVGSEFERSLLIKKSRFAWLLAISLFQIFSIAVVLAVIWQAKLAFVFLMGAMALIGLARSILVILVVDKPAWREGARQMRMGFGKLGPGAGAYLLGSVACSHAPVFALSFYASPIQAAAFGAMRTLYQPAQIFFRSRDVVTQSRFHMDRAASTSNILNQFQFGLLRTALLSLALSALFIAVGPWLVHGIYAGRYDDHMPTFWLWAIIMLMINLAAITDAYVSYVGLQGRYALTQLSAGLLCIVLSVILAKQYGDIGAAISAICGWLVIVTGGTFLLQSHAHKTHSHKGKV